jgi:predicted RNase H-like nuclease
MGSLLTWRPDLETRVHQPHCSLEAEVAPNAAKRPVRHLKHVAEAAYHFRLALTRAATTREQQVPDWMVQVAAKSADTDDLLAKIGPALEEAAAARNDPRSLVIGALVLH